MTAAAVRVWVCHRAANSHAPEQQGRLTHVLGSSNTVLPAHRSVIQIRTTPIAHKRCVTRSGALTPLICNTWLLHIGNSVLCFMPASHQRRNQQTVIVLMGDIRVSQA